MDWYTTLVLYFLALYYYFGSEFDKYYTVRQLLKKINRAALECSVAITEENALKSVTDNDVDGLAEAIELLNDVYEELYNKVFEESEEE